MNNLLKIGEEYYDQGLEEYFKNDDIETALRSFLAAAATEYEQAYGEIGSILFDHMDDPESAEFWFRKVQDVDFLSPMAQYEFGVILYNKRADWKSALPVLLKAAEAEYTPAYQAIGLIFYKEKNEVDEAEAWFEKAKEAGYLYGIPALYYGILLEFERGMEGMAEHYKAKAYQFYGESEPKEEVR